METSEDVPRDRDREVIEGVQDGLATNGAADVIFCLGLSIAPFGVLPLGPRP